MTTQSRAVGRICGFIVLTGLIFVGLDMGLARAESGAPQPRTTAHLEQLVAPIALYPDSLLSQILMASTYPLEVVEAARWLQANPGVTGQALEDAMQSRPWDPSVKALTAVPQTLQMMNDKLDWTQQLGDAFLAQQTDVLDAVQRLRERADNAGNLKTTEQQKVTKTSVARPAPRDQAPRSSAAPANIYVIESTNPDEYYLPIYDPGVVYGPWPYPDYAPFYWYPSGYVASNVFSFAAGVFVGAAIWGHVDWGRHRVGINVNRFNQFNRTNITNNAWTHNPVHRGAVPYRDSSVAQRFGDPSKAAAREDFRGKADVGRREIAKQGGAGKAKQGGAGKTGQKRADGSKSKATAGPKQTGGKAASTKKAGTKQAGSKQAAQAKQASRAKQSASAKQSAGRGQRAATTVGQRPSAVSRGGGAPSAGMRASGARSGGMRAGAGGGRGGGRRSDIRLKDNITLLGHLDNGLGFYRFTYYGSDKAYVGVMAQEVQTLMRAAVVRDRDGYLKVYYDQLGLKLQTYDQWIASGGRIPVPAGSQH